MNAIYHILHQVPNIYAEDMEAEYELLAQQLVRSGKLRIDTDDCCNFVRFSDSSRKISTMLSKEELTSNTLIPHTISYIKSLYNNSITDQKITKILENLKQQLQKLQPVPTEITERLARIFVQSAHPIVIRWIILDKVEVFITYSHNIGDMMDIENWQRVGSNSGMQSTNGHAVAIFVSCGGNPFAKTNYAHPTYGDGWPAVARMQIIAAQEIGHFADIKRDNQGRQITRHSANFAGTKANEAVKTARKLDIINCNNLLEELLRIGMKKQLSYENKLKFYNQNKIHNLKTYFLKFMIFIYKAKLLYYSKQPRLTFIRNFTDEKYMALMIQAMIKDMLANLLPTAEVYKNSNPEIEEAIACIEALARVPQQVMKWGYLTTKATMHDLYKIYYQEVLPSLITSYNAVTGQKYEWNHEKTSIFRKISSMFTRRKLKLKPVREI